MANNTKPKCSATVTRLDWVDGTKTTLFATWTFNSSKQASHVENFTVTWEYSTGQSVWFSGSESSVDGGQRNAQYTVPTNARYIRVKVTPKSKTHQVTDKKTKKKKTDTYFSGQSSGWYPSANGKPIDDSFVVTTPGSPSSLTIDEENVLTVTLDNYDNEASGLVADTITFQIIKDDDAVYKLIHSSINYAVGGYAAASYGPVERGSTYKARCLASAGKIDSEWSNFSSSVGTYPAKITEKPMVKAASDSSMQVGWQSAGEVFTYEVQWVPDNKEYFDTNPGVIGSDKPSEKNDTTERIINGLTANTVYFFRVRAVSNEGGTERLGEWSPISDESPLGTRPEAPTTWSYQSSVVVGEPVILNWVHNSEDGSTQTAAQIEITINEGTPSIIPISGDTSYYEYPTTGLADGIKVSWKVCTKGILNEFGEWSGSRLFTIYTKPEVEYGLYENVVWSWDTFNFDTDTIYTADGEGSDLISTVTKFPFVLKARATPSTQTAISFYVTIVSNGTYETLDETGLNKTVNRGDTVFSGYFPGVDNAFSKTFRPSDIDLQDDIEYTFTISAAMNSGLSGEAIDTFNVDWENEFLYPTAQIGIDYSNYSCYITPICEDEEENEILDVFLSVYRREYNGKFTPVAENIEGHSRVTVTDPHPSLDYARYRIVAASAVTGDISYTDLPPERIGGTSIILQWDDEWQNFIGTATDTATMVEQPISGSYLELPYNIDISADSKHDVALVEYIGRSSPVSYYGTQEGENGKWSCEIPKSDAETLYAIRRLAAYMGDVYVREPSGIGYWANVTVSYNMMHSKMTVPITFTVTRVEGGA